MSRIVKSFCLSSLPIFLTLVHIVVVIPCCTLLYFPFLIYRQIVIQLALIYRKDSLGKIVTSRSSILIAENLYSNPKCTLISFLLVEGVVNIQNLRETFRRKVLEAVVNSNSEELLYPELRQNVDTFLGFPFWRRLKNFDMGLGELIHFRDDNENATTNTGIALELMKRLCFKPFSQDKPLWEIIILPNFIPDRNFHSGISEHLKYSGVIIRCHHGLADGISQLRLVQALSNCGENFHFIKSADYTKQSRSGQTGQVCCDFVNDLTLLWKIPFALSTMMTKKLILLQLWTGLNNVQQKQKIGGPNDGNVDTNCLLWENNKAADKHLSRFALHQSHNFPLSEISEIKKICGAGVNGTSILYAAVVAATRNTLFTEMSKIPENILVITPLPLPRASGKLRNHITVGSITVPLAEGDSKKRLEKMHKRLTSLKHSMVPIVHAIVMKAVGSLPSLLVKLTNKIVQRDNLVMISNIAGPTRESDFAGHPIRDFLNTSGAVVGTNAITVSLISIGGNIRMGVAADIKIIESDEKCKEFSENFFKEMVSFKNNSSFELQTV